MLTVGVVADVIFQTEVPLFTTLVGTTSGISARYYVVGGLFTWCIKAGAIRNEQIDRRHRGTPEWIQLEGSRRDVSAEDAERQHEHGDTESRKSSTKGTKTRRLEEF